MLAAALTCGASGAEPQASPAAAWRRSIEALRAKGVPPLIDLSSTFTSFDLNPGPLAERLQELGVALMAVTCGGPSLEPSSMPCAGLSAAASFPVFMPLPTGDLPHHRLLPGASDPDRLWEQVKTAARQGAPLLGPMHYHMRPWGRPDREPLQPQAPDDELVRKEFDFCAENQVALQLIGNADDRFLPALERLLAEHPQAKVIWSRDGQEPFDAQAARRLLGRHPNLYLDLAYRAVSGGHPGDLSDFLLTADGRLDPGWKRLMDEQPWRFLSALGLSPRTFLRLPAAVARQRSILSQLKPATRPIVAYQAAWRILFGETL
ncbi:MAG: hypothetical protein NTY77_08155 [Elusimicrobia bacterium]|nr:hypothetical protein [Elusimicrobiota bacterium]